MEAGAKREGQEGSRWVNARPSGEEVASWFKGNVQLHEEGLDHEHYVQGLTLIQQTAKEKTVVGWTDDNKPVIDEIENLYYVPYPKVETRVKYFWDYVRLHDDWLGTIDPVQPETPIPTLPPGFGKLAVATIDGKAVNYITFSARARILLRDTVEEKFVRNTDTGEIQTILTGKEVMRGAPGTKMVPTLGRYGPDNFSVMKAETGAVGRALGLLGMLVVPGSGVATAEDMQEAIIAEGGVTQVPPQTGEQAELVDDDAALRQQITAMIAELGELDKARLDKFRAWVRDDRKIGSLADATSPQLRGLHTKLEGEIAAAKKPEEAAEKA